MPLYEYKCDVCGTFEQWRTLDEVSTPMLCPTCETVAKRVFSPPSVNLNSGSLQLQSGEPRVVKRSQDKDVATPQYSQQRQGRPWMVSH
jgi:putative FmdB family regulatory protein